MSQSNYPGPQPGADETVRMMRYDAAKKSVFIAYLLWFFLSALGVHRFYLGSWKIGLLILACTGLAFVTAGLAGIVSAIIVFLDLFLIPGMVSRYNQRVIASLT